MPILHVRGLRQFDKTKVQVALKLACIAISETYGCELSEVWATWEEIEPGLYIQGSEPAFEQPKKSHPPMAQLICEEGQSAKKIQDTLLAAAHTLSEKLDMPNNMFITYHETRAGRIFDGGALLK